MELADYILVGIFAIPVSIIILDIIIKDFRSGAYNKNSRLLDFAPMQKRILESKLKYEYKEIINYAKYKITNRQFEYFCAFLFEELGYKAIVTSAKNDKGKDIILDDGRVVVECKQYTTSIVGREICQKLVGAGVQSGADEFYAVTTGHYNNNAREMERTVKGLKLFRIQDLIYKVDQKALNLILEKTIQMN